MTHSIIMNIKIKDYDDVETIWNNISVKDCDGESAMSLYRLKKDTSFGKSMDFSGLCPFIYFPYDNKCIGDDGYYYIYVNTGTHCSWYDFNEILFMWTFWVYMREELENLGVSFEYWISEDSIDNNYTIAQAWKKILSENEELNSVVKK